MSDPYPFALASHTRPARENYYFHMSNVQFLEQTITKYIFFILIVNPPCCCMLRASKHSPLTCYINADFCISSCADGMVYSKEVVNVMKAACNARYSCISNAMLSVDTMTASSRRKSVVSYNPIRVTTEKG